MVGTISLLNRVNSVCRYSVHYGHGNSSANRLFLHMWESFWLFSSSTPRHSISKPSVPLQIQSTKPHPGTDERGMGVFKEAQSSWMPGLQCCPEIEKREECWSPLFFRGRGKGECPRVMCRAGVLKSTAVVESQDCKQSVSANGFPLNESPGWRSTYLIYLFLPWISNFFSLHSFSTYYSFPFAWNAHLHTLHKVNYF